MYHNLHGEHIYDLKMLRTDWTVQDKRFRDMYNVYNLFRAS